MSRVSIRDQLRNGLGVRPAKAATSRRLLRSIEDFAGQHGCDLRPAITGRASLAVTTGRISFALDLGDPTKDELQPIELTAELALEAWRHLSSENRTLR